jgi:hypothetical protein
MSEERIILTPNPTSSVSCLQMTPFIKPHEGDATVNVTVNRESTYTGPYTVQIRRNGFVIASTTLATPDEEEVVTLVVPAAELAECEAKLEACVASTIETSCCPYPIPATLKAKFQVQRDGVTIASPEVSLNFYTTLPPNPRYGDEQEISGYYGAVLLDIPCRLENVAFHIYFTCEGEDFEYGILTVHGEDNGELNGPDRIPTIGCSPLYLQELSTVVYSAYCDEGTSRLYIVDFHVTE